MNPIEIPLPKREGVFERRGTSMDFTLRRRNRLWKDWYWINTPNGINCAHATELSWDDEPKAKP